MSTPEKQFNGMGNPFPTLYEFKFYLRLQENRIKSSYNLVKLYNENFEIYYLFFSKFYQQVLYIFYNFHHYCHNKHTIHHNFYFLLTNDCKIVYYHPLM